MQVDWSYLLKTAVTNPKELLQLLELSPTLLPAAYQAARLFPLRVPQCFIARMKKGDPNDPLLLQVLPLQEEWQQTPGFSKDPLDEKAANPLPGLLHKYRGRVLLTVAPSCAVNCRYCFRRHFSYKNNNPGSRGWTKILTYIQTDNSIHEIIFSGGDPLLANDRTLATLTKQIAAIPHVKTLRIHSRLPIVLPQRITPDLINWFTKSRLHPVLVIHCNHPQEIDTEVTQAMKTLRVAGVTLLNQSVLLKGINDSVPTLVTLSKKLFDIGVLPYYLHLLDKVQGTAHFEVEEIQAQLLYWEIRKQLSGYLVPTLVKEQARAPAKLPIFSQEIFFKSILSSTYS